MNFINNKYNGEIIGFIETNKSKNSFMGKPVYDSSEIPGEFDYIVVTNLYATEIYDLCIKLDFDISKFIFLRRITQRIGCTDESVLKDILLDIYYTIYCTEYNLTDNTFINADVEMYKKLNKRPGFAI